MTQAELEATPGYQFTLAQGLKAASRQRGRARAWVSAAVLSRAHHGYATGLANSTYKDQFNIAQQRFSDVLGLNTAQQGNITNQYNRASGLATLGENAGAQTGTIGANLASTSANMINQAGVDTAAGISGIGKAATGAAQNYLDYTNFQNYLKSPDRSAVGTGDMHLTTIGGLRDERQHQRPDRRAAQRQRDRQPR